MHEHSYQIALKWTGNNGKGTVNYRAYSRAYEVEISGKPIIHGSADPAFRGDITKYNPEELLVASVSSCHMLWYLHLCADAGVVVIDYRDFATGKMRQTQAGDGKFTEVILKPEITVVRNGDSKQAKKLHEEAHKFCFIANSVNFPIVCQPVIREQ